MCNSCAVVRLCTFKCQRMFAHWFVQLQLRQNPTYAVAVENLGSQISFVCLVNLVCRIALFCRFVQGFCIPTIFVKHCGGAAQDFCLDPNKGKATRTFSSTQPSVTYRKSSRGALPPCFSAIPRNNSNGSASSATSSAQQAHKVIKKSA